MFQFAEQITVKGDRMLIQGWEHQNFPPFFYPR